MDYKKELLEIATESINTKGTPFFDAGCGMYNLDLPFIKGFNMPNEESNLFQISIDGSFKGDIYIISYSKINDDEYRDCTYGWNDITEMDEKLIYDAVVETIKKWRKKPMETMNKVKFTDFIKANTLADKVALINAWEEDRMADGEEYVYDLKDENDMEYFINLYGVQTTERCEKIGRYWFGGNAYYANEEDKRPCRITKIWNINEDNIDHQLNAVTYGEIEDRYNQYIEENKEDGEELRALDIFDNLYGNLVDAVGYYNAVNAPTEYMWVAMSNDGAFEDWSVKTFETKEECYTDMRNSVLEKMKWNTEWCDVIDGQGEEGNSTIGYKVHFAPNYITHESYSGYYKHKIISTAEYHNTNEFWDKFQKELREEMEKYKICI